MLIGDIRNKEIFRFIDHPHNCPDPALYEVVGSNKGVPGMVTCKYLGTVSNRVVDGHLVDFPANEDVINFSDYNSYLKGLLS